MSTLDDLRRKWFLDFESPGTNFPPAMRHEGSNVSDFTDGNIVIPLIDGKDYMSVWHISFQAMIGLSEMYHGSWRLDDVRTLGHSDPTSSALQKFKDAHNTGVALHPMICGNIINLKINVPNVLDLNVGGILNACIDNRYPVAGSNHQKFSCFKSASDSAALLGSIDIAKFRWDTTSHLTSDPERAPGEGPTHDVGVLLQGPTVADIEHTFIERWNDSSRQAGKVASGMIVPIHIITNPLAIVAPPKIGTPISAPSVAGPQSVQVLHTYGRTKPLFGYSWSPVGEFTVWASYLNAILQASKYIYIEDQYFLSFSWPPCFRRTGIARNSDLIYQLGEAIKHRGVKVAVLVPNIFEDAFAKNIKYQRDVGVHYLASIAATSPGDFVIAHLHNGTSEVYVHSKLMICDDEFALIGSANFGQRSMTHDSELHIGVIDADKQFARSLRMSLWQEHLQQSIPEDPDAAYGAFKTAVDIGGGRVRPYPTDDPGPPPSGHGRIIRVMVDRYAGPPR